MNKVASTGRSRIDRHCSELTAIPIGAVAKGNLSQSMNLEIDGRPMRGEYLRISTVVNTMVDQLAANLTTQVRAIAEVATAVTKGDLTRFITVEASGEVASLKDNINEMIRNMAARAWACRSVARSAGQ